MNMCVNEHQITYRSTVVATLMMMVISILYMSSASSGEPMNIGSINAQVDALINDIVRLGNETLGPDDYASIDQKIENLLASVEGDAVRLVSALLDAQKRHLHDEQRMGAAGFLVSRVLPSAPKDKIISAVERAFDEQDPDARGIYEDVLGQVLEVPEYRVDLGPVRHLLIERNGRIDDRVVHYLIRRWPDQAILELTRYFVTDQEDMKRVLLAYRELDNHAWKQDRSLAAKPEPDEVAAVITLANHEQWWLRLYAARMLHRYHELRTPAVVQKLREDSHQLVRNTVAIFTN